MPPRRTTQRRPAVRPSSGDGRQGAPGGPGGPHPGGGGQGGSNPPGGTGEPTDGFGMSWDFTAEDQTAPQLLWLDPRVIIWPDTRITSQYREGEREALSASLEGEGQQQAIGVYLVDGEYLGADGKNRCLDAIEKGKPQVLCLARQGTVATVRLSNIATSLNHGHANPLGVVETLWATHQEGIEIEELMAAAGHSKEWVEKMLLIAQASPAVKQALGEEFIALGHAELLSEVEDEGDQERALGLVLQKRWTVAELEEHLSGAPGEDDGEAAAPQRSPAPRSPQVCTVCHVEQQRGTIQTMHVCDGCAAKIGKPGDGAAVEAAVREALPELRRAKELLMRLPGGTTLAERLGALAEMMEQGKQEASDG